MLDFPRIQFVIVALISGTVLCILIKKWKWYSYLTITAVTVGVYINATFLINYTTLVPVQVPWAEYDIPIDEHFTMLISNVKMTNRNAQPLKDLIHQKDPDLILLMEVDQWWNQHLQALAQHYPYAQHTINNVAYGMILYSKFPLQQVQVDHLTHQDVPSFQATVTLPSGQSISLHTIHPVPPTYFKNLPDNAGQQENALKKLGDEITTRSHPTIVAGDLNDPVWSKVDQRTGTKNSLFDVRVGRGFYNTYNAKNPLMRWPLDHIFVTKEFQLKQLQRLPSIGSDHFPIYAHLILPAYNKQQPINNKQ